MHEPHETVKELDRATTLATFDLYLQASLASNQRRRRSYFALSPSHQLLLPDQTRVISKLDERLRLNHKFVSRMVQTGGFNQETVVDARAPSPADHEKLRSALRMFVRDWSSEVGFPFKSYPSRLDLMF